MLGKRKALFVLVMTGRAGSEVKVNSSVPVLVIPASVTIRVTRKLPSIVTVPEISPVAGSAVNPGGRPIALNVVVGLPPLVITWNLNGLPVLPVALVGLITTGPVVGNGSIVSE